MASASGVRITTSDEARLDELQQQTLRYFWDFAHPVSGLARDRSNPFPDDPGNDKVSVGGSGFGVMALCAGVSRGWLRREAVVERLCGMLSFLKSADRFHGVFPHFLNGRTGRVMPFSPLDDGGDLVETALLMMGLLAARQFFDGKGREAALREAVDRLWHAVEWCWHLDDNRNVLIWHWSEKHGFAINQPIQGWNECLIVYVLAIASEQHGIDPAAYHSGWATGRDFRNGQSYYDITLPLGPRYGGPLFFAHYSFLGIDPRGLVDRYADYFDQNVAHCRINHRHCVLNPGGFRGYGPACWGLTASDSSGPDTYRAHSPEVDVGVITPTAALSSFPYVPDESMAALLEFRKRLGGQIWTDLGFMDAFNETTGWTSRSHLAIDQGPIVVMVENHRSGLLWRAVMSCPEVRDALTRLGFASPHLATV